ncbi:MAG: alanine dehydrogenase [Dysgonamonadaceae bacterium]|jgi:alanine dehydrogenase|nr:alanine dehydrogenase [Dysgonamonadaceae bacterium]
MKNESINQTARAPKELQKEITSSRNQLSIGIPRESDRREKRLALTPEAVDMISEAGHKIFLESGAGDGINYSDNVYSEAGAVITGREEVFSSDCIMKIAPLTPDEIALVKKRASVFSMLQIPDMSASALQAMSEKNLNAVGYELLTDSGTFPIRDSISEIEGMAAVSVASELLNNERGGKGILFGGITGVSPAEVVIIGAGVAGTVITRIALAMGATVKVFDSDLKKLRKLQKEVGLPVFTSVFQPNVLLNAFRSADVVFGAMRFIDEPVRFVISEDVIRAMKRGSLIIDIRITQGGCFETTCLLPDKEQYVFEKHGITHYCVPNVSSRVARTTSMALSNVLTNIILQMNIAGGIAPAIQKEGILKSGFYMFSGKTVNPYVAKCFNLPAHDLGLFLSAF